MLTLPGKHLNFGLVAQPTKILGKKLKLSRQRALGLEFWWILGWSNLLQAGINQFSAIPMRWRKSLTLSVKSGSYSKSWYRFVLLRQPRLKACQTALGHRIKPTKTAPPFRNQATKEVRQPVANSQAPISASPFQLAG